MMVRSQALETNRRTFSGGATVWDKVVTATSRAPAMRVRVDQGGALAHSG